MVYLGIYGGLTIGLLGWFFGRQAAAKKRGLDEVYHYIWGKARSTSWYITAAAIYVLMTLELLGIKLNLIPALSILLFVMLSSWAISGAFFSMKLSEPSATSAGRMSLKLSAIIGSVMLLLFSIISAVTGEWRFLLAAIPPIALNIAIAASLARRMNK